jgi:aquaporin Z
VLTRAPPAAHMASFATGGELPRPIAASAPGIMVMAIIYFLGSVSGAHLNPAVSFAFALRRNFPWSRVPAYVAGQLTGATLAVLLLRSLLGETHGLGMTVPHGIGPIAAMVLELVITAGLVNTILGTASGARNVGTNAGIAVGGYIALTGLWASYFSGASMNPARSFGPALVSGKFEDLWIYVAGPLIGAATGVGLEWLFKGPPTKSGTEAAQGSGH